MQRREAKRNKDKQEVGTYASLHVARFPLLLRKVLRKTEKLNDYVHLSVLLKAFQGSKKPRKLVPEYVLTICRPTEWIQTMSGQMPGKLLCPFQSVHTDKSIQSWPRALSGLNPWNPGSI